MPFWPIEPGRGITVPYVVRSVIVPPVGSRPALGNPPFFDAMDAQDQDMFNCDFSQLTFPGDALVGAAVTASPASTTIGPPLIFGNVIQALVGPSSVATITYDITFSAAYASGRVIDWGIEVSVQPL